MNILILSLDDGSNIVHDAEPRFDINKDDNKKAHFLECALILGLYDFFIR